MIQGVGSGTFDSFIAFAELLSDPKRFKAAIAETKKAIADLEVARAEHEEALKIAPTVEAALALMERNKELANTLDKFEVELKERDASINKDVAMEASKKMKDVRAKEAEVVQGFADLKALRLEQEKESNAREIQITQRENEYLDNQTRYQKDYLLMEERKRKFSDAFGGTV